jgi:F0F1-type ATP synthase membrane subunit a
VHVALANYFSLDVAETQLPFMQALNPATTSWIAFVIVIAVLIVLVVIVVVIRRRRMTAATVTYILKQNRPEN